eukprot:TRINITY_DN1419_c0_g1_i1.p1 TRINITY_DN1419_c0_g1~~TRINITY_DN1419_c0_g1_i1.p1  ORF type:complete len:171 (+),score=32.36 TRINITY_DN1419_c0_g1_i1:304-816(+)
MAIATLTRPQVIEMKWRWRRQFMRVELEEIISLLLPKLVLINTESLKNLSIESLDLYLIHWPGLRGLDRSSEENKKGRAQTWKAMETLYKEGKCKAIGVSNYTVKHLETLLSECSVPPMVNQVELHPYLQQKELLAFCEKHNIKVEAYTSLGQGKLLQDADVQNLSLIHI